MPSRMQLDSPHRQTPELEEGEINEDVDMTSPSPVVSPAKAFAKDFTPMRGDSPVVISSDLSNLRISGSHGQPLFPSLTKGPKMSGSSDKYVSSPFGLDDGKKNYTWNSMAEMISAHVEELKKRPPLGTPKDKEDAKQSDQRGGESQQTSIDKGKGKAM
ncbi:hypothetical protein F4805DRAFT_351100 [Annulohypoxylon moriforme]|nr:hypothetical protein F4805DRAFT_351100 [Annulohypoxylon moriforme]